MSETIKLQIEGLAHKGDGVAETPDGPVFVPFALAGETVTVERKGVRAELRSVDVPSPERVTPVCRHFGTCGGCALQHMERNAYLAWKRQQVIAALADRGIETEVAPVIAAEGRGRRRAVLTALRAGHKVLLGFHERASHRLVDVQECPVLVLEIVEALERLRKLSSGLLPRKGELRLTVTATRNGLDAAFERKEKLDPKRIPDLVGEAMEAGLTRLSVNGEVLVEARPAEILIDHVPVIVPPAGFLQATKEAEERLSRLVLDGAGKAKKVIDLFSGIGTFTFPLAKRATVHAVEGDAAALKALDGGLRRAQGRKTISHERRDLFRNPVTATEIDDYGKGYDAVVFDPPRAGAEAQAREIARSKAARVVAVSCNPATLARDLRILIDGGYHLKSVTPVDQFLFSPHIEVVAALER
ncbi:class I SAM-dependent RNA methyltransferase [Rhizobiales bacterium]|uniref:class I SAM-dependent RNA methyltransferase n=1 Tax=Hongsoonwoonella zoysiae TaxID=2821844 RepID=UPI00155FC27B|nr:class I SAM-dependent RNA methyltransferase [Hongsoonwoonella zoysiae]NRG19712.1 class I SAM-dependent RNA methyltransferase [Hongsoonwoonella zoysiae]